MLLSHRVAESAGSSGHVYQSGSYSLKAPIYDPQKLICVGMNYVDHCTEQNIPVPEEPVIFSKFSSAITEPDGAVIHPNETDVSSRPWWEGFELLESFLPLQSLDYEVELAFIISRRGKHIKVRAHLHYC